MPAACRPLRICLRHNPRNMGLPNQRSPERCRPRKDLLSERDGKQFRHHHPLPSVNPTPLQPPQHPVRHYRRHRSDHSLLHPRLPYLLHPKLPYLLHPKLPYLLHPKLPYLLHPKLHLLRTAFQFHLLPRQDQPWRQSANHWRQRLRRAWVQPRVYGGGVSSLVLAT